MRSDSRNRRWFREGILVPLRLADDAGEVRYVRTGNLWRHWRNRRIARRLRLPIQHLRPTEVGFVFLIIGVVMVIVVGAGITSILSKSFIALMFSYLMMTYSAMLIVSAIVAARFRSRSRTYIRQMKDRALCPACIGVLDGLDVPPDGMVACPECGARWRFDPKGGSPPEAMLCAGCGYALDGLPRDAAGAVRCPECGMESNFEPGTPHLSPKMVTNSPPTDAELDHDTSRADS